MIVLETQFSGDNVVLVFPDGSSPALLSAMMAGIPYNKAHVLEFSPGEIRLDVTMASTLQLYQTKVQENAEAYNSLIQQGKKELDRLRSLSEDELISKKDIQIEKERLEIEEEYQRKEAARLAKEQEERQARLARQRELARSLQPQSTATSSSAVDEASLPPLVIGGAFAAYAVVALSSAGQGGSEARSNNNNNNNNATDTMIPMGNATMAIPLNSRGLYNNGFTDNNLFGDSSSSSNMAMQGSFPSNIIDETIPSLYGETSGISTLYNSPSTSKSVEQRQEDARTAMQKYMDEDDGGDAWLQVMANIIQEDDEDDDSFFSESDEERGRINGSSKI